MAGHPSDIWINGYKQDTRGFGKLLRYSKPLDRVLRYLAVQHAHYYRKNVPRSKGPGPHTADLVRVEKHVPGGRKKDRMEFRVVAYGDQATRIEWPAGERTDGGQLRKSLVYISGGRTISRGGR